VAKIIPCILREPEETSGLRRSGPTTSPSTCLPQVASPVDTTVQAGIENARDINRDTRGPITAEPLTLSSPISEHSGAQRGASRTTDRAPFVDLVTFMPPKSILQMSSKECLPPVAFICVIFFLWGFAYGFINVLNEQFRRAAGFNPLVYLGLHASYFGAYAFGPIVVARPVLKRWGFKATLVTGLSIYSCGTLVFWPASILISLPAFVIANFIVGLGLSVTETASDLFVALCGPLNYSEIRLNVAKGVQAVGGVISPILAQQVLYKYINDAPSLISVQWTYLVITIVAILVAVTCNFLPLPEVSNDELKRLANHRREDYYNTVCGIRVVWVTLTLGVLSQFCNIGGQEGLQTQFSSLVLYNEPK
jgi:fucose permease